MEKNQSIHIIQEVEPPCLSPSSSDSDEYAKVPRQSLQKWPSTPQRLHRSLLSRIINILLDVTMCLAPLILLMKCGLVVLASRLDKWHTGQIADPPSNLTLNLIGFNTQVSFSDIIIINLTSDNC